jgi:hypothetical protein
MSTRRFDTTYRQLGSSLPLLDAIAAVYRQLGFDQTCDKDAVFEQLVTARIIEPTSKQTPAGCWPRPGCGPCRIGP